MRCRLKRLCAKPSAISRLRSGRSDLKDHWTLSFARKANDDVLDNVLRLLQQSGAVIQMFSRNAQRCLRYLKVMKRKTLSQEEKIG